MPWNFVFKFCLATVITKRSFYPIFVVLGKLYDSAKYISRLLGLNQIQLTNSPLFLVKSSYNENNVSSHTVVLHQSNLVIGAIIKSDYAIFFGTWFLQRNASFLFWWHYRFLAFNTITQNGELTDAVSRSYAVSRLDWIRLRQLFNQKCFWE